MPTAALIRHMRAGGVMALLAEIDHPDGTVHVWSRSGTLAYGGHDWTGLGIMGRVRSVGTSRDLKIRQTVFELRGVPATAIQFLSANVRGRVANLWFAGIKPGRVVVADPWLLQTVKLDYQTLALTDDGKATISLIAYAGFWTLDRAQDLAWTSEQQKSIYPDDTGLDLIPSLVSKDIVWRQA
jgi:hypothetical protein